MFDREVLQEILKFINSKEIIFLLGTRRTGKTTLTKLIQERTNFKKKFYYDLEDIEYRELFKNISLEKLKYIFDIEGFLKEDKNLLIFDEIQHLNDPSNLLKLIHDYFPNIKVIATGSSSLKIKQKFSDSLAGRNIIFVIQPLSFNEFLIFKNEEKLLKIKEIFDNESSEKIKDIIEAFKNRFLLLFEEYLIYGGYPEVVLSNTREEKIQKLNSIVNSYIQKDIRDIANIENIDLYNNLLKYLVVNFTKLLNFSTVSNYLGISHQTLKKYLLYLEETFILKLLPPFFTNKKKEIAKNKKIFFYDNGLRNLIVKNFSRIDMRTDVGEIYENYVFSALSKKIKLWESIYFYRTQSKTEIDFIIEKEGKLEIFEVKSSNIKKIPKAIKEFKNKYPNIVKTNIITHSYFNVDGNVRFLPAFLL